MITLKYDDYPKYPKLKTSNSAFQNGGLSYHLFEEDYTEVYGDTQFDLGFYTFDLIFTLIYLRRTSTIHDHAYANLTPLKLQFEIKKNEVVVYLPYFEGNLEKDDNWGAEWGGLIHGVAIGKRYLKLQNLWTLRLPKPILKVGS